MMNCLNRQKKSRQPFRSFLRGLRRRLMQMTTLLVAITHPTQAAIRNTIIGSFIWYMGGLSYFLAFADFTVPMYKKMYWIWAMGKDPLFILSIYSLLPKYRKQIFPILFFSLTRFTWEIIAQASGQDANRAMVVDYMFWIVLSIISLQLINTLRNSWSQNS